MITKEKIKWEKPKLTVISTGGIKENILTGTSDVPPPPVKIP